MKQKTTLSGNNSQVVICLDSFTDLWKRLYGIVRDQRHWEVCVATRAHATADIAELCQRHPPALLVMEDTSLDILSFPDLSDLIGRRDLRILVFSAKTDDLSLEHFFRQGCAGVLPPDVADITLRRAMRAILEGELWLPRRVLSKLALASSCGKEEASELTKREAEILAMINVGLSNQEIADHLFISRETVRWHLRSLYSKSSHAKRIGTRRVMQSIAGKGNSAIGQQDRNSK